MQVLLAGRLRINLKDKAQVSLELVLGLIVCLILILGATRLFFWLNQCIVERQEAYEATRHIPRDKIDFYTPKEELRFFPKEK